MNKIKACVHYINGDTMLFYLCLKIFFVRIIDVSLGTVRTIMSVKNKNLVAALIGFVEITVWFLVVKEALNTDENSFFIVFSYAAGFSTGTYIGGLISSKYIKGYMTVQVITDKSKKLSDILREKGYGVSVIDIRGKDEGEKSLLLIQINNNNLDDLKNIINKNDSKAFIIINETKYIQNGFIKK